jgi:Fic family protein
MLLAGWISRTFFPSRSLFNDIELLEKRAALRNSMYGSATSEDLRRARIWKERFSPFDITKELVWQGKNKDLLGRIDIIRDHLRFQTSDESEELFHANFLHESAKMEGSQLPDGATERILRVVKQCPTTTTIDPSPQDIITKLGNISPNHLKDTLETINHVLAFQFLNAKFANGNTKELFSEELFNGVFRILTGDDSILCYRNEDVAPKNDCETIYPRFEEIPTLIKEFFEWVQASMPNPHNSNAPHHLHILVFSLRAYAVLLHIHPFLDWNGRIARLFINYLLFKSYGYLPLCLKTENRAIYLEGLRKCNTHENNLFFSTVLSNYEDQLEKLDKKVYECYS